MALDTSILSTIKTMLSIDDDLDAFDQELLFFINTTFPALEQLGVLGARGFAATKESKWNEIIPDEKLAGVQSYIFLKVKMIFDAPGTASLQSAYERMISEVEWRLNVTAETELSND